MISTPDSPKDSTAFVLLDAGLETIRCSVVAKDSTVDARWSSPASQGVEGLDLPAGPSCQSLLVTGKLAPIVQRRWPHARLVPTVAAYQSFVRQQSQQQASAGLIEISASGYTVVALDTAGSSPQATLRTNPRCGAGPGVNIDRVLQKLAIARDAVDRYLVDYLDQQGQQPRRALQPRADRCGVFAASATISDKNQGIPLTFALATTLKSEVLKACKHLEHPVQTVWLTGGIFRWRICRDFASDYLHDLGVKTVRYEEQEALLPRGVAALLEHASPNPAVRPPLPNAAVDAADYPAFTVVEHQLSAAHHFLRLPPAEVTPAATSARPLLLAIDAGSTMAKAVLCSADGLTDLYRTSISNAGDTLDTIKALFRELHQQVGPVLPLMQIGLTGSARYQLKQALAATYPQMADRIQVLVENYAHARGSIDRVRQHIAALQAQGVTDLDTARCVLVDVGGEDTKISTVDLARGELLDNAMNSKCSAGTGSLLDTLAALFELPDIAQTAALAKGAAKAYALNATCAVFLLEHARRLQAEGRPVDEIVASAVWAITENMARSLWNQLDLPRNAVVLLHGQTMQSDPLPLAVIHRLQRFLGGPVYGLVPPYPGHRACYGLIRTLAQDQLEEAVDVPLSTLIDKQFEKRLIQCRGAACGDKEACCHRTLLTGNDAAGQSIRFSLGGCSAINERTAAQPKTTAAAPNLYQEIWQFIADRLPVSQAPERLVIPRAFAVSEWAAFFAELFTPLGIPVHVDAVGEADILRGQPHFNIDTCAPHIGAVGQMLRLAEEPHGMILAPQIEFLPVNGGSLGRTCTINQGGPATATGIARARFPASRIHLFYIDLKKNTATEIAHKLFSRLEPVFAHYEVDLDFDTFLLRVEQGLKAQRSLRNEAADFAAKQARFAWQQGAQIAVVVGREYILNPGVYDSHVGRLLRDKGVVGVPSYLLDVQCDAKYKHLYWRNSHQIATLAAAATQGNVHGVTGHQGLKRLLRDVEQRADGPLPLVQVSTFLCGPDSVTNPLVDTLVKSRPFLRIQSDAAIKELAHLENRVNTYVKQLVESGHQSFDREGAAFDVELLQDWVHHQPLDPQTDVVAFPTLSDNRPLVAVLKAAGFTCIDSYDDGYQLTMAVERGRSVAGDSVCAPLAAVYGDVLSIIARFRQLRAADPIFASKERLMIFNNKGLGPCRQGQYVETHKLFLQQQQGAVTDDANDAETMVRFLVGHENEGFDTGFPRWVFLRGVQSVVLQGVLHQLLLDGAAGCSTEEEFQNFTSAYRDLVGTVTEQMKQSAPSAAGERWLRTLGRVPGMRTLVAFFAYGFHRNPLRKPLRNFSKRWIKQGPQPTYRIHIDGETYMRSAQLEALHRHLLHRLGLGRARFSHTPLWSFLEYKIAGMMMRSREAISQSRAEIRRSKDEAFCAQRRAFMRKKQKRLIGLNAVHCLLRRVLAAPLYRAAGVSMPAPMPKVLELSRTVVSTRRPGGELMPFVGESVLKLRAGCDLVLNVAPEGCMVSSMGDVLSPAIQQACPNATGKVLPLFSQQGEIDGEQLEQILLQALGPEALV